MIINFSVKNFRSIKDEITIEFNASSDKDHINFVTETKYCNILNANAIYGLNASGKSNIIRAIQIVDMLVYLSFKDDKSLERLITPFLFDAGSRKLPSEFNINFVHNEIRYEYGFAADKKQVYSEWMYAYPNKKAQLLFTREWLNDAYEYKFGANYKGERESIKKLVPQSALFLSVARSLGQKSITVVSDWFAKLSIELVSRHAEMGKQRAIDYIEESTITKEEMIAFLIRADISISDFDIKEENVVVPEDFPEALKEFISDKNKEVITQHLISGQSYSLSFSDESSGTQQVFNFAAQVIRTIKNGGVLVIDELNSFLHPLLVKHIVGLFGNLETNPQRAQLIFTTHETSIMTTDFLRRDQIWFCDKSKEQSTMLYSAQEFSPRKTDNLEKAYLAGRYGAIPIFTN
ncbi:MAG: AAA family ATPase [Burkholderiales bacterium]|nr:AAA family ATPase [Burkholderiales bacterium]MBP9768858.1 AAA family ATPase [Burkholderiales bacterium]